MDLYTSKAANEANYVVGLLKKYGISNHEIKEAKEQNKKEKVLLMIAILNWLNAILMLIILLFDF